MILLNIIRSLSSWYHNVPGEGSYLLQLHICQVCIRRQSVENQEIVKNSNYLSLPVFLYSAGPNRPKYRRTTCQILTHIKAEIKEHLAVLSGYHQYCLDSQLKCFLILGNRVYGAPTLSCEYSCSNRQDPISPAFSQ